MYIKRIYHLYIMYYRNIERYSIWKCNILKFICNLSKKIYIYYKISVLLFLIIIIILLLINEIICIFNNNSNNILIIILF